MNMSWFQQYASPDIQLWQIVKYSFLCNVLFCIMTHKNQTIKQTARTPRGVISAAVDGCSAADMSVNHNRNSLKHPHNIWVWGGSCCLTGDFWHFAFHLSKDKLFNKYFKLELLYLWLKIMIITHTKLFRSVYLLRICFLMGLCNASCSTSYTTFGDFRLNLWDLPIQKVFSKASLVRFERQVVLFHAG